MSGWVAGTPLSSGLGRFMLPCRTRALPAESTAPAANSPPLAASMDAAVGLLCPLADGDPLLRSAVTSRAATALSSTCSTVKSTF